MNFQSALSVFGLISLAAIGCATLIHEDDDPQGAVVVLGPNDRTNPTPGLTLTVKGPARKDKVVMTEAEWKKKLTLAQYKILRGHGTEAAFCSPMLDVHQKGVFHCAACDNSLFSTDAKFDSGTGWPSFFQPVTKNAAWYRLDTGYGMRRTEALCSKCDSHLGHVFNDGPRDKTGYRFCMNGEALKFVPDAKKK